MGSYASATRQDRWKAIAAVVAVHVVLGAAILSGLDVQTVRGVVERLQTFDVTIPKPPPPPPPPPPQERPREQTAQEGAPESRPSPSPVVAPKPQIELPVQSPVPASEVAGTGSGTSAGAGGRGTGTGSGGTGQGTGTGAGAGDGRGFTPAQRIRKIPNSEYRRFVRTSGIERGQVGVRVKVNADGTPSNCRIVRSSGNSAADSLMCQLTLQHVRFRPALDPQGRPVAQDITWFPDWSPNR